MDYITITFGIVIILYGVYTIIIRKKTPEKFAKLAAMKEKLGDVAGNRAHVFFYSIMPIIFGSLIILAGTQGLSLMEFFTNQ